MPGTYPVAAYVVLDFISFLQPFSLNLTKFIHAGALS